MEGPTAGYSAWAANLVSFVTGQSSFHLLFPHKYPGLPRELGGHWSNSTSNARALQKHLWLGAFMRTKCPLWAETAMGARSWEWATRFCNKEAALPLGRRGPSPGSMLGKQSTGGWKATRLLAGLGTAHSLQIRPLQGPPGRC